MYIYCNWCFDALFPGFLSFQTHFSLYLHICITILQYKYTPFYTLCLSFSLLLSTPLTSLQVLRLAIPETLQSLLSVETLIARLPASYLKAVFAAFIASRFVYTSSDDAAELGLHQYLLALRESS